MRVAAIKALVQENTGVPVEEQRIFCEGQELIGDAALVDGPTCHPLTLVRSLDDPRITGCGHFRAAIQDFEPLPRGQFSVINTLASGDDGEGLICRWKRDNAAPKPVMVMKMCNSHLSQSSNTVADEQHMHLETSAHELYSQDSLTDIGVLKHLCCQADLPPYLERMLGVYEDDGFTWLVHDMFDSTLSELVSHHQLGEAETKHFTWQLLQAVAYLHDLKIGHRSISLQNVVLRAGRAQLMDFSAAVPTSSASGVPLRYFRCVGEECNRAPEVYVPHVARIPVVAPSALAPNRVALIETQDQFLCQVRFPVDVQAGQSFMADVWGYSATPADVFSSGVCLFTMACKCPPWHRARLADPNFSFAHHLGDQGILDLMQHCQKEGLDQTTSMLLAAMLRPDPTQRPSATECLRHNCFTSM
jgi:serine/threonine protein kinase